MPALYNNQIRLKPFILEEAGGQRSRDNVTVTQSGAAIVSGTLLGKITASGKYIPYSNGASDGSQTVAGILYEHLPAATGDVKAVIINVDAEVNRLELTGLDAPGEVDLLALGIKVRGNTTSLSISTPTL